MSAEEQFFANLERLQKNCTNGEGTVLSGSAREGLASVMEAALFDARNELLLDGVASELMGAGSHQACAHGITIDLSLSGQLRKQNGTASHPESVALLMEVTQ